MNTDYLFDDPELLDDDDDFLEEDDYSSSVDYDNPCQFVVKIHHLADGATSLAMVADMLRDYANFIDTMHDDGYRLASPIANGQGFAYLDED